MRFSCCTDRQEASLQSLQMILHNTRPYSLHAVMPNQAAVVLNQAVVFIFKKNTRPYRAVITGIPKQIGQAARRRQGSQRTTDYRRNTDYVRQEEQL